VTRGCDDNAEDHKRAVYAYYGGDYETDSYKYYMKAVLAYAQAARNYLQDHPVVPAVSVPDAGDLSEASEQPAN